MQSGLLAIFFFFLLATCETPSHYADDFEATTLLADDGAWQNFETVWTTEDTSAASPTLINRLRQQYQGGTVAQRATTIEADPKDASNKALKFRLTEPNLASKGRVQTNLYLLTGSTRARVNQMRLKHRFYMPANMASLRTYTKKIAWLTISEWWNDAPGLPYPFRITVGIWKYSTSEADVHFGAMAETYDSVSGRWNSHLWRYDPTDFAVPFDQWMEIDYFWGDGNADGRFYMAVTPEGGTRRIVVDHTGPTHDPANPSPPGFAVTNNFKLYTDASLIDYMRNAGSELVFWFDDLDIQICTSCTNLDPASNPPATSNPTRAPTTRSPTRTPTRTPTGAPTTTTTTANPTGAPTTTTTSTTGNPTGAPTTTTTSSTTANPTGAPTTTTSSQSATTSTTTTPLATATTAPTGVGNVATTFVFSSTASLSLSWSFFAAFVALVLW